MAAKVKFKNKYTPKKMTEFFSNESQLHKILQMLFSLNDLNILLCGQTGVGKTLLANILIGEYYGNAIPYKQLDDNVLIINNLRDYGVQFYRNEFKLFCQNRCTIKGKKKMVIIDDLDSITESAQHIFRNCIDKYKHNVHFIMTCTNIQNIIDCLQSNLHLLTIEPATKQHISQIIDIVIENEGMTISPDVRQYLLKISPNISCAINHLEKLFIYGGEITRDECEQLCYNVSMSRFEEYFAHVRANRMHEAIECINGIYDMGYSVCDILHYLSLNLHELVCPDTLKFEIVKVLCKYNITHHILYENVIQLTFLTNELCGIFSTN